jgi:serine phosphatase RsbU (regulator of sigma subunit)
MLALKTTKVSFGGLTADDQEFTMEQIQLQQDDTVYLFSDGYADMFGGAKGKKLTTGKFRELLTSIQNKSVIDQEVALKNFADEWMNNHEQVDDILIRGGAL